MSSIKIAFWALIVASLLWATSPIVSKILLQTLDPFVVGFLRFGIAALLLLPVLFKMKLSLQLLKNTIPLGLLSSGNIVFFLLGLQTTTAISAALIYTFTPLFVAGIAKFTLKETHSPKKMIGIMFGLVGVLVILFLPIFEHKQQLGGDLRGNFLIFLAVISWTLYTVRSRHLISIHKYSPLTVTTISILVTALVFLVCVLLQNNWQHFQALREPKVFLLILYTAISVTVITYVLYQWAIKHSSATTAALSNYLQPIFSILLSVLLLGEKISMGFLGGTMLTIVGLFLTTSDQLLYHIKKARLREQS